VNRAERIGQNEAFFRQVNERVQEVNETFSVLTGTGDLICECGNAACVNRITMPMEDYRELRADATLFAVVPGHEIPDVEDVVDERGGYGVVRKHEGDPAEIARELR
jgi:hypothetical protein